LLFVIPMAWFEGELVIYLVYFYPFAFPSHFLHTHLSHFASLVILAYICSIMRARMSSNEIWTFLLDHAR
jgi:hypothetical protein